MKLYLVRHAIAEDRTVFAQTGQSDDLRPLIPEGIQRMHSVMKFLIEKNINWDLMLQSPLYRSQQTATICNEYFPQASVQTTQYLAPGFHPEDLFSEILSYQKNSIAIVGHEPDLGYFLSWLLFKHKTDGFSFKKSGVAKVIIKVDKPPALKWFIQPKMILGH